MKLVRNFGKRLCFPQAEKAIVRDLVGVWQKESYTDTPADLQNISVISQGTCRHYGADSLGLLKSIRGQSLLGTAFKMVDADVGIPFAFGHPYYRSFDRMNLVLRK